jgi:site-specific recombinase XerD
MNKTTTLTKISSDMAAAAMSVDWQTALETFLNTLSSPRTMRAYERAITEAMEAMGVDFVAKLTPPMLAEYRAGLVARLDADREDRLSPSTVNLKLGALRSFLHFCRVTGVSALSKDVIAFVLKSPKAEVRKPYEGLNEAERQRFLEAASRQGLREYTLVSLALGAGLRVSE